MKNYLAVPSTFQVFVIGLIGCLCSFNVWAKHMIEVRYVEIPVADIHRAVKFYESVFDIKLERDVVDGYQMAHFPSSDSKVGADITLAQGDVYVPTKNGAIVYFSVESIDATILRAVSKGAEVLYPKKMVSPQLWVAEFQDSEGNRIALSQRDD